MRFFEPHILFLSCTLPLTNFLPQMRRENVRFKKPHILFPLCTLSHTVSYRTAQRMCGSKNHTFSAPCIPFPVRQEREHAVQRTSRSLSLVHSSPQNGRENVRFFEPHILCLLHPVSCETGQGTCSSKNRTFPAPRALPSTKYYRECMVLRTTHSLPLAYHLRLFHAKNSVR